MRLGIGAACACLALLIACGGVNTSDKRRGGERTTAAAPDDDDDDSDNDSDAGGSSESDDSGATPSSPSTPSPPSTPADAGNPVDAAPAVPEGSFAAGTELETTANLNLREGAGVNFAVIVTIPVATRVKVQTTSGADGWVHLDYQGNIGYSSKMFLKVP